MRRPQRRLHLMLWLLVAPAAAAGLLLALRHAPVAPVGEIPADAVTDGAR